jgi:hypothetical protein
MAELVEVVAQAIDEAFDDIGLWRVEAVARAALAAIDAAGYAVVPKEPSEAMRIAAINTGLPMRGEPPLYEKLWRAMLAAASENPSP